MANKWVEFVRKWASKNDMNYMCAMTNEKCKADYRKENPVALTKTQQKDLAKKEKEPKQTKKEQERQENIKKWRAYNEKIEIIVDKIIRKVKRVNLIQSNAHDILRYFRSPGVKYSYRGTQELELFNELEKLVDEQDNIPMYIRDM